VSLSHAFRFRVQGIKIYDIFITKTSAVSCGRTGIPPTRSPLPRWFTHSASTLTLKICSQARQAIIWTWALETAIATAAQDPDFKVGYLYEFVVEFSNNAY